MAPSGGRWRPGLRLFSWLLLAFKRPLVAKQRSAVASRVLTSAAPSMSSVPATRPPEPRLRDDSPFRLVAEGLHDAGALGSTTLSSLARPHAPLEAFSRQRFRSHSAGPCTPRKAPISARCPIRPPPFSGLNRAYSQSPSRAGNAPAFNQPSSVAFSSAVSGSTGGMMGSGRALRATNGIALSSTCCAAICHHFESLLK